MAREVSDILGATAVITSGSHVKDTLAVDLLGREFGWRVDSDSATVTRVSAAIVNDEPVGLFQEAGETKWWHTERDLPDNVRMCSSLSELLGSGATAGIAISDKTDVLAVNPGEERVSTARPVPLAVLRPRSLVVGMGCRRGVTREHLEELLSGTFNARALSPKSIKCIATADVKSDEAGILELADKYGVPVECYAPEQLNSIFEDEPGTNRMNKRGNEADTGQGGPIPSPVARRLLGVWGVAEPAALLASGADRLLVNRQKTDRATIAVARIPFDQM